ncbi:UNKNOWN [Stylonychia lemnae]|uniref:Uncharacterized protein n=1 Tax=Stylonychia lemnae TaxID=5949 RepID=A0A078AGY6_STYLE|nr:UNKNOWN [Stylonychia lemnae]|eukprot:CDW81489.1 UNKNOWN [Stylonychia lemnae]
MKKGTTIHHKEKAKKVQSPRRKTVVEKISPLMDLRDDAVFQIKIFICFID